MILNVLTLEGFNILLVHSKLKGAIKTQFCMNDKFNVFSPYFIQTFLIVTKRLFQFQLLLNSSKACTIFFKMFLSKKIARLCKKNNFNIL